MRLGDVDRNKRPTESNGRMDLPSLLLGALPLGPTVGGRQSLPWQMVQDTAGTQKLDSSIVECVVSLPPDLASKTRHLVSLI